MGTEYMLSIPDNASLQKDFPRYRKKGQIMSDLEIVIYNSDK